MRGRPVVAVTGAAGGIGRALCERFARGGMVVAVLDLARADPHAVAGMLPGGRALGTPCDVTKPRDCDAAVAAIVDRFGRLDVLVNNAGVTHIAPFESTSPQDFARVIDVNVHGAVNATRAALPAITHRRGNVTMIASVAGIAPLVHRTAYAASKHALVGFGRTLRTEVADRGVDVTVVCPGFVTTGLGGDDRPEAGPALAPADVADAVWRGVRRGKRLVLPGVVAKVSYAVDRVAPRLYEAIMPRLTRRSSRSATGDREVGA